MKSRAMKSTRVYSQETRELEYKPIIFHSDSSSHIVGCGDRKNLAMHTQNCRSIVIQDVYIFPEEPEYSDSVMVYAIVINADSVYMNYTYGSDYHCVEMIQQTDNQYFYTLPPNSYGTTVVYRIQAYNYSESSSAYSEWYNFTYSDFTPPIIGVIDIPNQSLTLRPLGFRINVSEDKNASGVYCAYIVLQYSYDNRTWGDSTTYVLSYNSSSRLWEIEISFIDYGYYRYYFVAEDNAGNIAYLPNSQYYYLRIYPRYAEIIGENITVPYSDNYLVKIQLIDLNDTEPIKYAYVDVYLNKSSGLEYLTTIETNGTGYAWFILYASWSVGGYGLVFIFEDSSYKRTQKAFILEIVPDGVVFSVEADTNTYNASLIVSVLDDEGEEIDYGYIRVLSGEFLFDEKLNDLVEISLEIDIFEASTFMENGCWWLQVNITFYGNPNYALSSQCYRFAIYASMIQANYSSHVRQGEEILLNINISDLDGLLNYTVCIDGEKIDFGDILDVEVSLEIPYRVGIGEAVGVHYIVVDVYDAKNAHVRRKFRLYVDETKIILNVTEFEVLDSGLFISGFARYEVPWCPENISIKVVTQRGDDIEIHNVENKTIKQNEISWNITIHIEGEVIIKIIASDPQGHTTETSKTLNIPPRTKEIPLWLPIVVSGIAGISIYLLVIRKRKTM